MDYYREMLNAIAHEDYDSYPTGIIPIPISDEEASLISYYDAMGRYCDELKAADDGQK